MSLPYNKKLIPRAKELRRNATPQENRLWYDFLRHLSIRFQRQKAISSFIADFYCASEKLIIEVDGSQHSLPDGKAYDMERDAVLERFGLRVLRITNYDIDNNFSAVCDAIRRELGILNSPRRLAAAPPSKRGAGGSGS